MGLMIQTERKANLEKFTAVSVDYPGQHFRRRTFTLIVLGLKRARPNKASEWANTIKVK